MPAHRLSALIPLLVSTLLASDTRALDVAYWDLPTGSHIAFMRYPAGQSEPNVPVLFLHGGPGGFIVDHPEIADRFYESLAALGFNVYLYDQIGSGRSARLSDPREYTVDRHIRDLEAIRRMIGAETFVLIGESWGATLAANYIAEHPGRCSKAIFTAPGALSRIRGGQYRPEAPMFKSAQEWFASLYAQPRYRAMRKILSTDILDAYRSNPDREMDVLMDAFVQRSLPHLVCDPACLPADALRGMGWWVNLMTAADIERQPRNPARALARANVPVLILRGGCDYLRWEVALQYKKAFANSTLLYLPGAGHAVGYDQPKLYSSAVRAFLLGQPLPLPPYDGTAPPGATSTQRNER